MSVNLLMERSLPTAVRSVVRTSWIAISGSTASRPPHGGRQRGPPRIKTHQSRQDGAPCLEAEPASVSNHVDPHLMDDADDTEGNAHPLDMEAIGAAPSRYHLAGR